jgi:hypothetical protein
VIAAVVLEAAGASGSRLRALGNSNDRVVDAKRLTK